MKKIPVFITIAVLLFAGVSFLPSAKNIIGNWRITYKDGSQTHLQFNGDGTFRAEIPAENFVVGGKYTFKQNVLRVSDTSCNAAYWGRYKLTFHGQDTVYSTVIEDSCAPRRGSADKATLVRER